jgi:putative sugar O-methyltransferase
MNKNQSKILNRYESAKEEIPNLYKPGIFWEDASKKILNEIEKHGIENFRRLKTSLNFFVPTYGLPGNSFNNKVKKKLTQILKTEGTKKQQLYIKKWLNGALHAESDFRVFIASFKDDNHFKLKEFSESSYGNPIEQFSFNDKKYSRSSLNYLLGLCFLDKFLSKEDKIDTIMEIGGGFGTLGEILSFSKNKKYINLDINPISWIAWKYLKNIYKDKIFKNLNIKKTKIANLPACSVLNSWNIENLEGKIDLFVNFISFQEMEPNIVENYLNHIVGFKPKWILLRNIKEGKQRKTNKNKVGVKNPIKSNHYIDILKNNYSLHGRNILGFGFKTVDNFNSELLLFKIKK